MATECGGEYEENPCHELKRMHWKIIIHGVINCIEKYAEIQVHCGL